MTTKAKMTGVLKDGYLVEVEDMFKVKRYAQPVFAFPMTAAPYQDWIDTYKDKFLAVITFENDGNPDDTQRALMIGIVPLENNQTPAEGLDGHIMVLSKNYRQWINDVTNEYVIDVLNSGKIKFGNKNVTEPALLGDKTKSWLEDLIDSAKDIATKAGQITVPTPAGTSGPPVNAADFIQIAIDLQLLKQQISSLLSQTVYLE